MSDLDKVRALLRDGLKEAGIATRLGITRHRARVLVDQATRRQVIAIVPPAGFSALSFYDTARQALAQAKTLSEVKEIADKGAAMAEYGRRAKDVTLKLDAEDIQVRAAAAWGRLSLSMGSNKGARGQLSGRDASGGAISEPPEDHRPTLKEMGVDKKFSANAKKLAKLSDCAIEARLAARREEIAHVHAEPTPIVLVHG